MRFNILYLDAYYIIHLLSNNNLPYGDIIKYLGRILKSLFTFYFFLRNLLICRRQRPQRHDDFMAGDKRVNEQPFLSSMHVLFLREHNRIAKLLKEYLPRSLHKVYNKLYKQHNTVHTIIGPLITAIKVFYHHRTSIFNLIRIF